MDFNIATTYALLFIICMEYHFFTPSLLPLCVLLNIKWVSCRQHIAVSCFIVCSITLFLLIEEFSPFMYKIIIDRKGLTFVILFCSSFVPLLLSSFGLCWIFCSDILWFLYFFIIFCMYLCMWLPCGLLKYPYYPKWLL